MDSGNEFDHAIRAAWEVAARWPGAGDSGARESLVASIQDAAERRTDAAISECAKRFEIVAGWKTPSAGELSARASEVAAGLRALSEAFSEPSDRNRDMP